MPVPQKRARFKGTHLVAASLRSKAVPLVRHAFTQYDRLRSDSLGLGITLMRVGWPGRPKLDIDRLALDLLDRGSGTDSYGWIELRQLVGQKMGLDQLSPLTLLWGTIRDLGKSRCHRGVERKRLLRHDSSALSDNMSPLWNSSLRSDSGLVVE
ncbi:unnamed protein product [Cochlearia groenlandica]